MATGTGTGTSTVAVAESLSRNHHHLQLNSVPLIDLRLLSCSELYSLSLCSSSSQAHCRCDDDILIPKIDRSVFNESAGSRKQTYSRLRLAPPCNSHFPRSSATPFTSITSPTPELLDQENLQIVGLLKQLFPSKTRENQLDSIPVNDYRDSLPQFSNNVMRTFPIHFVVDSADRKKKRGRPPKDLSLVIWNEALVKTVEGQEFSPNVPLQSPVTGNVSAAGEINRKRGRPRKNDSSNGAITTYFLPNLAVLNSNGINAGSESMAKKRRPRKNESNDGGGENGGEDLVNLNRNGEVVDLVALGNVEDPFGEELRKRTEGLKTVEELLGFMGGFEGEWVSTRKKKKIVQASEFGNALPRDWKIMLSLKRKGGHVSLFCRRYISPKGQEFVSCKEVSSYMLAYFGAQDGSHPKPSHNGDSIQDSFKVNSGDATFLEMNRGEIQLRDFVKCVRSGMTSDESNNVKGIGAVGGPTKLQENSDFLSNGAPLPSLKKQESIGLDTGEASSAVANKELDSSFAECGFIANSVSETCNDTEICQHVSILHEAQVMYAGNDEEYKKIHDKWEDIVFNITGDDQLGKLDEGIEVVSRTGLDLAVEYTSSDINKSICKGLHKIGVTNCIPCETNDSFKVSFTLGQEPKLEIGPESGLFIHNVKDSRFVTGDVEDTQFSSRVENVEVDHIIQFGNNESMSNRCRPSNIGNNMEQKSAYPSYSLQLSDNEVIYDLKDGNATSPVVVNSLHERANEINLHSSSADGKACILSNDVCNISSCSFYASKFDGADMSGIDLKTTGVGRNLLAPDTDVVGRNLLAPDTDVVITREHDRTAGNCLYISQHEERIVDPDILTSPGCAIEEFLQDRRSGSNVLTSIVDGQNSFVDDSCSESLIFPSACEKVHAFENYSSSVSFSTLWNEQHEPDGAEKPVFGRSGTCSGKHCEPSGHVLDELISKSDEQNMQSSRAPDAPSQYMKISGCFPNFDLLYKKGTNGAVSYDQKFDSISGLEELRSGGVENLDYNSLSAQGCSNFKESKVLSHGVVMEKDFGSAFWFEKEEKTTSNHPCVMTCVWCWNEFYHEVVNSVTQSDSVGLMCTTCQAKFSGHFNPL